MTPLEWTCATIVGLYALAARPQPRMFATIAVLAWCGEQSCISLYGFYGYSDAWALKLGDVPVLVALIWPVVVLSARAVRPGWLAGLVLLDAAFIEPIAVHGGLWGWTEPGFLHVPAIGVLGWAWFAWLLPPGPAVSLRTAARAMACLVGLHAGLITVWWLGFRSMPAATQASVLLACVIGAIASCALRWSGPPPRLRDIALRAPGAAFFVWVLAREPTTPPQALLAWAALIAMGWLLLIGRAAVSRSPPLVSDSE